MNNNKEKQPHNYCIVGATWDGRDKSKELFQCGIMNKLRCGGGAS